MAAIVDAPDESSNGLSSTISAPTILFKFLNNSSACNNSLN